MSSSLSQSLSIFEKARRGGLDERQIALAQTPMTHVHDQQMTAHMAMDRVIMRAAEFDQPGVKVVIVPWLGKGSVAL